MNVSGASLNTALISALLKSANLQKVMVQVTSGEDAAATQMADAVSALSNGNAAALEDSNCTFSTYA